MKVVSSDRMSDSDSFSKILGFDWPRTTGHWHYGNCQSLTTCQSWQLSWNGAQVLKWIMKCHFSIHLALRVFSAIFISTVCVKFCKWQALTPVLYISLYSVHHLKEILKRGYSLRIGNEHRSYNNWAYMLLLLLLFYHVTQQRKNRERNNRLKESDRTGG